MKVEQISKWIVDNESQYSPCQRKRLQINKEECYNAPCTVGLKMEISYLALNTEIYMGICLEMS